MSETRINNPTDSPERKPPLCDLPSVKKIMKANTTMLCTAIDSFCNRMGKNLEEMNTAVKNGNYEQIENMATTIAAFIVIWKIVSLKDILKEMEDLAKKKENIKRLAFLNTQLHYISWRAIDELTAERMILLQELKTKKEGQIENDEAGDNK